MTKLNTVKVGNLRNYSQISLVVESKIFRVVAPVVVITGFAFLGATHRAESGPVLCIFRSLTGKPCPFCGSTRAVAALCSGDITQAVHYNPLGIFFFVGLLFALAFPQKTRRNISKLESVNVKHPVTFWSVVAFLFMTSWVWNIAVRW